MPDYDMVVIGSGFAGSTAALSFLETTEKAGQVGRVALIEAGKKGTWPGGSRWTRPFMRLNRDNKLMSDRAEGLEQGLSDLDYWRKLEDEVPNTIEFMEDHGVKLIHHDEENAALDFEGRDLKGEWTWWAWPTQPIGDVPSAVIVGVLFVAGLTIICLAGARETPGEEG